MMTDNSNEENKPKAGDVYEITAEGSLGLLAMGYKGIRAWRKKRAELFIAKKGNSTTGENLEDEQKDS